MNGGIFCNKDGAKMSDKTDETRHSRRGTCPKCSRTECHIFFKGKRYYSDVNDTFFTYVSALSQLTAMNREVEAKTFDAKAWLPGAIKSRKVKNAILQWLNEVKEKVSEESRSYGTYRAYLTRVNTHILHKDYGLGEYDLRDVKSPELKIFLGKLKKQTKAINTHRAIMLCLHSFFSWAVDPAQALIEFIPQFPTIEGNNAKEKFALDVSDQLAALAKIPEEHRAVFEFASEVGTRPGETSSIKIRDIDFKARTIRIQRTWTGKELGHSDKGKHKKPIYLLDHVFELVKKHAEGRFPDEWLFINPQNNSNYTVNSLARLWYKHTGLKITHYEGTRHSFATQITEKVDLTAAQDLLRHADPNSTRRYVHHKPEYLRNALQQRTNIVEIHKKEKVG